MEAGGRRRDRAGLQRDIAAMDLELAFSDLAMVERRLERVKVNLKSAKPPDRPGLEKAVCECYAVVKLEFDRLISDIPSGDPLHILGQSEL